MSLKKIIAFILAIILFSFVFSQQKGKVYLVPGSDTSIWDGLDVNRYDGRLYNAALYADPSMNGYAAMDTSFRNQLRDSYGTPMKMTWWMMAGNVFDMSVNCNIPIRTNVTLYLMKKYHQEAIDHLDDQLSLHYHTYYWSDTDGDGVFSWKMAPDFSLNQDDYERTLCTFLIEDDVFPISFRSGWMYMDLNWQDYQERFIPFDMSDCWSPYAQGTQPYHPAEDDYRVPGDLRQWRVRSFYFTIFPELTRAMKALFSAAAGGEDQMACFWSHLPEAEYMQGMDSMNTLAHQLSEQYGVDFMYCKDTEAMRLWINPDDTLAPVLNFDEIREGDHIRFRIATDGPVFQKDEPFVAMKTRYETYERLACRITGENQWETIDPVSLDRIAKVSVAVCDSVGNQSKAHLNYLPDDLYIDEKDPACHERSGSWENYTEGQLWDLGARLLRGKGSIGITPDIPESRPYAVFYHSPGSTSDSLRYIIQNSTIDDTLFHTGTLRGINHWQHMGFFDLEAGQGNTIIIENLAEDKDLGMDVLRITPLIADKHFILNRDILTFGNVSVEDTAFLYFDIFNNGREDLTIYSMHHYGRKIFIDETFPLILAPMEQRRISVSFSSMEFCEYNDIIIIQTDDPKHPSTIVPVFASALSFYKVIDDLDSLNYSEYGDNWKYSIARAWGNTSRYTSIRANGDYADFTKTLKYSGTYDLQYIVPTTSNAHNNAHYIVFIDGNPVDTVIVDQNANSGKFVSLGEYDLPRDVPVTIRVQDNGNNTNYGAVLRADAVKFLLIEQKFVSAINEAGIPEEFKVFQNYPNPFNPSTQIYFALPEAGEVRIDFFDVQGRKIDQQIQRSFEAGYHRVTWTPVQLASGVYLYRVQSPSGTQIGRCTFIK